MTSEPEIGDITSGRNLPGVKDTRHRYIFSRCPICGKERWVTFRGDKRRPDQRCQRCSATCMKGENNARWRGGRVKHSEGYIAVKVYPDNFFYHMANKSGYITEHRLVMAKSLNRCLLPWEIVHHKNGIRDDNRLENLQLLPGRKYHIADTQIKSLVRTMQKRIDYLEELLRVYGITF